MLYYITLNALHTGVQWHCGEVRQCLITRSAQKQFAQPIVNLVMTLPSPRERCGGRVQEKPAIVLSISWMFPKMSMNAEGPTALCIYCVEREWVGYSD